MAASHRESESLPTMQNTPRLALGGERMEAFFRLCVCGHRESQHKIVNEGIFYERLECRQCKCKRFVPKQEVKE